MELAIKSQESLSPTIGSFSACRGKSKDPCNQFVQIIGEGATVAVRISAALNRLLKDQRISEGSRLRVDGLVHIRPGISSTLVCVAGAECSSRKRATFS